MHIQVLKSPTDANDVLHRLQTNALYQGLQGLGIASSLVFLDGGRQEIPAPSHIVIDYLDSAALAAAAKIKARCNSRVLCFFSDVFDLSKFIELSEVVDCFLAPTPLHRDVVQSAVVKPVVHIPESFDPISLPAAGGERAVATTNRFCWFGFPESFSKSMRYLLPQAFRISAFDESRFCILTSKDRRFHDKVEHRVFDAQTFYAETVDLNYSILSHFCFDQKLNTFIKSPNKMITSIVRGLVPYASSTPSYQQIAGLYGLEALLFSSPKDLADKLRNADFERDREKFGISAIRNELMKSFSNVSIARHVLDVL